MLVGSSMADLDLTAYDPLVVEHAFTGYVRQQVFAEAARGKAWHCDLVAGTLSITGLGTFRVDLLGTFSKGSDTFLWSWANPDAAKWSADVLAFARSLEHHATQQPGLAVFVEPKIAAGWVPPLELGFVCGELAGGKPLYIGQSGAAEVHFLVHTACSGALSELHVATWPRQLLDFQPLVMADIRACVERGLEKSGFVLERQPSSTVALAANACNISLHWREGGGIERLGVDMIPDA